MASTTPPRMPTWLEQAATMELPHFPQPPAPLVAEGGGYRVEVHAVNISGEYAFPVRDTGEVYMYKRVPLSEWGSEWAHDTLPWFESVSTIWDFDTRESYCKWVLDDLTWLPDAAGVMLREVPSLGDQAGFWDATERYLEAATLEQKLTQLADLMRTGCGCDWAGYEICTKEDAKGPWAPCPGTPDPGSPQYGTTPHWGCDHLAKELAWGKRNVARLYAYLYAEGTREKATAVAVAGGGQFISLADLRAVVGAVCAQPAGS